MVGDRTGETFRLGDTVEVKLVEAAPVAGALRFELLSRAAMTRGQAGMRAEIEPQVGSPKRAGRAMRRGSKKQR